MGKQLTGRGSLLRVRGDGGLQVGWRRPFVAELHQIDVHAGLHMSVGAVQAHIPTLLTFPCVM